MHALNLQSRLGHEIRVHTAYYTACPGARFQVPRRNRELHGKPVSGNNGETPVGPEAVGKIALAHVKVNAHYLTFEASPDLQLASVPRFVVYAR